jgi:two-component system cell cycle response regulator DivK
MGIAYEVRPGRKVLPKQSAVAENNQGVPPIILFVDDDRDTLDLYGGYFEEHGLWVVRATDPDEALEVAVDLNPNLVVADLGFADQPLGIELVAQLKGDQQLQMTPLIVLSGRSQDELQESRRRGADMVLPKPCSPQALLDRVQHLLIASRDRREQAPYTIECRPHPPSLRFRCPACGLFLEWIERSTLDGQEYDYFEWCKSGCGLYCYNRETQRWIKVA